MFGIESGSPQILKNIKKGGDATVEQTIEAVTATKKAGIQVWGYFVLGLPGETEETINESIQLAKKLPLDLVNFAFGAPYPGTEFHEMAKANGWLISSDWEDFDQNYSAIVSYENMSAQQIEQAVKRAYREWYLRPSGIMRTLRGIHDWDSLKALLRIGMEHFSWARK